MVKMQLVRDEDTGEPCGHVSFLFRDGQTERGYRTVSSILDRGDERALDKELTDALVEWGHAQKK